MASASHTLPQHTLTIYWPYWLYFPNEDLLIRLVITQTNGEEKTNKLRKMSMQQQKWEGCIEYNKVVISCWVSHVWDEKCQGWVVVVVLWEGRGVRLSWRRVVYSSLLQWHCRGLYGSPGYVVFLKVAHLRSQWMMRWLWSTYQAVIWWTLWCSAFSIT